MPHLIVESAPGLIENKAVLLGSLVARFSEFDTITASDVKARFYEVQDFVIGAGGKASFLHLSLHLMEGRDLDLKKSMSDALFAILKSYVGDQDVNVTLELREMDWATYRK